MIKDFTISYSGILIQVTQSVYKPFAFIPGLIRYTFHLPAKKVTVQRSYDPNRGRLYWLEVNNGETASANVLGEAYEKYCKSINNVDNTIDLTREGTLKVNGSIQYKYADAPYLWN